MRNRRTKDQLVLPWTGTMEWTDVPQDIRTQARALLARLLRAAATGAANDPRVEDGDGDA